MTGPVLIVDDSLTVRMDLQEALEAAGLTCVARATIESARAAIATGAFVAVLLDVLLPDGDGIELLRELRADPATADLPVLMLSTEAEVSDRVRGMRTGADDYVGKPYDRGYVVSRVEELLRRRRSAAADARPLVLVIDDSATFREHFRQTLRGAGYRVLLAPTGEDGLRSVAAARPDAVVVDAHLPDIDGMAVIRRLKLDAALRRTPCLLLTAADSAHFEVVALEAGADMFLNKGEPVAVILSRLEAMLRAVGPTATAGPELSSLFGPKRVLAVDDSPSYLQELGARIRQNGYEVILASSGEEALTLLAAQHVDCVLLDLIMPGISGQDACRRIKNTLAWRDIPLIMLTSCEDSDTMVSAFNAGADDYIVKSSDFELIHARLRAQIRRKYFEDENRRVGEELAEKAREAVEARAAQRLAQTRAALSAELERANKELEAFSYSVSHDLQAPLRTITAFGDILARDHAATLDADGAYLLGAIRGAAGRMGQLIEDLLRLAKVSRGEIGREPVDLSALVAEIAAGLRERDAGREVVFDIQEGVTAACDRQLVRAALENLLGNAWKYSSRKPRATIAFSAAGPGDDGEATIYTVRDDGAGFDPTQVDRIFAPFQRLHSATEFEGTGVGLATTQRIIHRHGGRIWAEGAVGEGAAFHFTLHSPLGAEASEAPAETPAA
ncbi:response regulator [Azospirillum agricola]|uniref:response regulator n=1 Tax=Azospirillum agricola TaxID=1720247 RepID=UPI000A0F1C1E|nr:response regulator [Azospirillum agricola]SMH46651.1 His Kinase A (phospho-acceptor) domain-containing protein [Azospirillum lipoferum]